MEKIKLEKIVLYTAVNTNHWDSALDCVIDELKGTDVNVIDWENAEEYKIERDKERRSNEIYSCLLYTSPSPRD